MIFHTVCAACTILVGVIEGVSVEKDLSLTLHEKHSLDKFKERVHSLVANQKGYTKSDLYLLRFLRARDFDLNAAERMLSQSLRWRKEYQMNGILNEDWSDLLRDYPATFDTHDKEGRPIGSLDISTWDLRRATFQPKPYRMRFVRYLYALTENSTVKVYDLQTKGMNVTQFVFLSNADGFNVIQHACPACIPYWIQYVQAIENNYNGWMDKFIIVDAPSTVSVLLEACRPFLSRQTREAFHIFGANRQRWMSYLDQIIAKDQRRPQHGGTMPCISA